MSTEANAALAWPVEITEFAYIGDQVADELSRESRESSETEAHFAWILWTLDTEDVPLFSLLGTAWPGKLYDYSPWHESRVSLQIDREFAQLYADAGFYKQPASMDVNPGEYLPGREVVPVLVPRRCVGDPSMDPTVLTEGCWVPWLVPAPLWDSMEDPGRTTGDANEPDDYDGYVDHVTGKVPGLDGVTYVDGSRGGEG
jgi:hypothetical protein